MTGRFERSWSVMKQSWEVLKLDKELLVFTVLSSVAGIIVLVSFVVPLLPALRTLSDGLKAAVARLPQIFEWALLSATIGFLLRSIEERVHLVGRIVVSLIGAAWTVVTYLVVPILAVERLGPVAAVQRSAELLRKSWGAAIRLRAQGLKSFGEAGPRRRLTVDPRPWPAPRPG